VSVTTVQARFGAQSETGFAKESVFGTAVAATTFLPMTGNTLELDPGLFFSPTMVGQRDAQIFPFYGQFKNSGAVTGPLFPSNAGLLIPAALGLDNGSLGAGATAAGGGKGITGTGSASTTTLSAGVNATGATTITLTSTTGYVDGVFVQVDANSTVTPTTAEVRKQVGAPTGSTITLDAPLNFTHANGAAVKIVTAPFTHSITASNTLPSLTVEKNIGGAESIQFSGARINKYDIQCQAADQEVQVTADFMAKHAAVLATPTPISLTSESGYYFAECTFKLNGQTVAQATDVGLTIDNGLKDTFTLNGSHELGFLTPAALKLSGKATVVFHNLDDVTWGYWNLMQSLTDMGTFDLKFSSGANDNIEFTCPRTRISKYTDAIKSGDVITSALTFEMALDLATMTTISATMTNSVYLPY
jgi:hypothetical protein